MSQSTFIGLVSEVGTVMRQIREDVKCEKLSQDSWLHREMERDKALIRGLEFP